MTEKLYKPKIIVIGDSHINAIRSASEKRGRNGRDDGSIEFILLRRSHSRNGVHMGNTIEETIRVISSCRSGDVIAISPRGSEHLKFSIIKHDSNFDYYTPDILSLPDEADIIPYSIIYDRFMKSAENEFTLHNAIRKVWPGPLYRLCAPPPLGNNDHVAANADTYYRNRGVSFKGVNDPFFRLKAWKVELAVTQVECKIYDMRLLMPPASCLTTDGFLAEKVYGRDATHANAIYGDHVLQELIGFLSKRHPAESQGGDTTEK